MNERMACSREPRNEGCRIMRRVGTVPLGHRLEPATVQADGVTETG